MTDYLDTCIVIYAVEGQAQFQQRAQTHIAALQAAGHRFAVSDLTKYECSVKPLGSGDGPLLLDFERFFLARNLHVTPLTTAVFQRAARIRGVQLHGGPQGGGPDGARPTIRSRTRRGHRTRAWRRCS